MCLTNGLRGEICLRNLILTSLVSAPAATPEDNSLKKDDVSLATLSNGDGVSVEEEETEEGADNKVISVSSLLLNRDCKGVVARKT
ncbi:hypothetical protein U1Q18_009900 [Sarracenia purpurea var. burkii]